MSKTKLNVAELERAIKKMKELTQTHDLSIEIEDLGRLVLSASDIGGRLVSIRLFEVSTKKMAELSYTERL